MQFSFLLHLNHTALNQYSFAYIVAITYILERERLLRKFGQKLQIKVASMYLSKNCTGKISQTSLFMVKKKGTPIWSALQLIYSGHQKLFEGPELEI